MIKRELEKEQDEQHVRSKELTFLRENQSEWDSVGKWSKEERRLLNTVDEYVLRDPLPVQRNFTPKVITIDDEEMPRKMHIEDMSREELVGEFQRIKEKKANLKRKMSLIELQIQMLDDHYKYYN